MRLRTPLDDVLGNPTAVRVLRTLLRHPAKEYTGRELAAECGAAAPSVIRELERLQRQGLVARRVVGRAHLWALRQENRLVQPLADLFRFERDLPAALRHDVAAAVRKAPGVKRAILYGSVARGDEGPESDVDVLIETDSSAATAALEAQIHDLRESVERRYGTRLTPHVRTTQQLRRARPLLRNIERDGIVLWERR